MVIAIVGLSAAVAIPIVQPALRHATVEAGLDVVSMNMRRARNSALDQRRVYRVAFQNNNVILSRQEVPSQAWTIIATTPLPRGVEFGIPEGSTSLSPPDGMTTSSCVDFNGSDQVWFMPDGSAVDIQGQVVNGIVYLSSTEHPDEGRAVTLFGSTGRVKSWHLHESEDALTGQSESSWK